MINIIKCAIAGAISAYGATLAQADQKVGNLLLIGGLVIIVLSLLQECYSDDPAGGDNE